MLLKVVRYKKMQITTLLSNCDLCAVQGAVMFVSIFAVFWICVVDSRQYDNRLRATAFGFAYNNSLISAKSPIPSTHEKLRQAMIFTKLDLRSTYNLIHITV
ncbi:hypothetical protein P4O66_001954 [Electrophorus voltai]|uniref:Uncharacterized protein n=1 Tax=Electrophorus voltai TaxID=2609070 RepID=A0AAD9E637_9TELE|nr:hypothetical protein P4O66_001954 [Electrophorus voltai]